jgi:hypothetical protein
MDAEIEKLYAVFQSIDLDSFESEAEYINQKRLTLDTFVFDSLKRLYSPYLKEQWNKKTIPSKSDRAIVIVERRCHPNLEFILHNVSYFAPDYTIYIFCSDVNLPYIKLICGPQVNNIHIHSIFDRIGTPEEGKISYNNILKTSEFWNFFSEEHILTMEMDSYLLRPIPDSIYEYDYVASQWHWLPSEPGGGGLSYRKCSIMKKICELDKSLIDCHAQDAFASNGIKILGGKYSHKFFTECDILDDAIGTHQWWSYYHIDMPKDFIKHHLTLAHVGKVQV